MKDAFWSVFHDTGDPMCYLLCKAGEKEGSGSEVKDFPDEFQMNPPTRQEPVVPHC